VRSHPLQSQHVARRGRSVEPQQPEVGAGVSLQRSAANEEAAGVVAAGLVADCRHRPVAEAGAVEEDSKPGSATKAGGVMM
jgi:hypothetical protein